MEFRDLKKQYNILQKDILQNIEKVLEQGNFILGKEVGILEKKLAEYVDVKECVTCANGTDALTLSMMALGIGKGDAVFVPDLTFAATAGSASILGAEIVFVDVDPVSFCMDPLSLEEAVDAVVKEGKYRPGAVIPVDLFGLIPPGIDRIKRIAEDNGMYVIEDGAQGFGAEMTDLISGKKRKACSLGNIGTTSFFPAKPLGCYGDGGAIFTDDSDVADKLRSLRAQGRSAANKYHNERVGVNSRLDTIQAAILLAKFDAFCKYELDKVNEAAKLYDEFLAPLSENVITPSVPEGYYSAWAQYTIKTEKRDELKTHLAKFSIPSMVYYPIPLHLQPAYSHYAQYVSLDNTAKICKLVLSLPMHPYLQREDIVQISKEIKEFFQVEKIV